MILFIFSKNKTFFFIYKTNKNYSKYDPSAAITFSYLYLPDAIFIYIYNVQSMIWSIAAYLDFKYKCIAALFFLTVIPT